MIVKVNKKWWQFWLPPSLDIDGYVDEAVTYSPYQMEELANLKMPDSPHIMVDHTPSAIEADDPEPWYNDNPTEESSVVTAEPPIVYANRGNARVNEREKM